LFTTIGSSVGATGTSYQASEPTTLEAAYKVNITTEHAEVKTDKESYVKDEEVIFNVTPDIGYDIDIIKATDKNGVSLKITEKEDNYYFLMPESDATVEVKMKALVQVMAKSETQTETQSEAQTEKQTEKQTEEKSTTKETSAETEDTETESTETEDTTSETNNDDLYDPDLVDGVAGEYGVSPGGVSLGGINWLISRAVTYTVVSSDEIINYLFGLDYWITGFSPGTRLRYIKYNGSNTYKDGMVKKAVYCMYGAKEDPAGTVTAGSVKTTKEINYILYNGVRKLGSEAWNERYQTGNTTLDYYITAMAIHLVNMDNGVEPAISHSTIAASVNAANLNFGSLTGPDIWKLILKFYNEAKSDKTDVLNANGEIKATEATYTLSSDAAKDKSEWREDTEDGGYRTSVWKVSASDVNAIDDRTGTVVNSATGDTMSGVKIVYSSDSMSSNFYIHATAAAYKKIKNQRITLKVTSSVTAHSLTAKTFSPSSTTLQPVILMEFGETEKTRIVTGTIEPPQAIFGVLRVMKQDKDTSATLSNATFTVYEWNGSTYATHSTLKWDSGYQWYYSDELIVTDENGGKFKVVETSPPPRYRAQNPQWSKEFVITETATEFEYTCENEHDYAQVAVIKKDTDTNELLAGATYTLYKDAACRNKVVNIGPTDEKGYAVSAKFRREQDTYYLKENVSPANHLLNNTVFTVNTKANAITEVVVKNDPVKPLLRVSKLAPKTKGVTLVNGWYEGEKEAGWYQFGDTIEYTIIATNTGNVPAKNIIVEDTMTEDLKNAVQALDATFVIPENIKTDKGNSVTITGMGAGAESATAALGTCIMIDRLEPGDSVTFKFAVTVKNKGEITILEELDNIVTIMGSYENDTGAEIEEGEIPEDEDDRDNDKINIMDPMVSISKLADKTSGATLVDGLYEGEKEPGWYDFEDTVTYRIIIRNSGNVDINDLNVVDTMSEDLLNAIQTDSATFVWPDGIKTDMGNNVTLTKVSATNFTIDKLIPKDSVTVDFTVVLKETAAEIPVLEKLNNLVKVTGNYNTPDGQEGEIPEDADDKDDDDINIANPLLSVAKLANKTTNAVLVDGRYQGEKTAGTYNIGSEVTYKITVGNNGNVDAKNITVQEILSEELAAAIVKGSAQFTTLGELKTKKGNIANVQAINNKKVVIDVLEPGDQITLKFSVTLKDDTIDTLEDLNNIVKVTGSYGDDDKDIPTDEDDEDNDKINVYQGYVEIIKTSSYNGSKLADAEFNIVNSKGKVVDTIKTDSKGYAKSKALPSGKYYAIETKAPSGYKLSTEKHNFELDIKKANQVIKLKIENDPVPGSLAASTGIGQSNVKTGDNTNILIYALLIIMAFGFMIAYFFRKKKIRFVIKK